MAMNNRISFAIIAREAHQTTELLIDCIINLTDFQLVFCKRAASKMETRDNGIPYGRAV